MYVFKFGKSIVIVEMDGLPDGLPDDHISFQIAADFDELSHVAAFFKFYKKASDKPVEDIKSEWVHDVPYDEKLCFYSESNPDGPLPGDIIDFWRQAVAVLEYVAVWYAPENGFPEAPHIIWYFQRLLLRYPAQLEGVFLELPEC